MRTYTSTEAAIELGVDTSRILRLCRQKRLGFTLPKHGKAWVITENEIALFRHVGPRKAGRPRKEES